MVLGYWACRGYGGGVLIWGVALWVLTATPAAALFDAMRYLVLRLIAVGVIGAALGVPVRAQGTDFTGTWVLRSDSSEARIVARTGDAAFPKGDMGIGWGTPLVVEQTARQLSVTYDAFGSYDLQPKARLLFVLDGSESLNTVVKGNDPPARSTVAWNEGALVITTTYESPSGVRVPPEALAVRQTLRLNGAGHLILESRRRGFDGVDHVVTATYVRR